MKDLRFNHQFKRSRFNSIATKEDRAWKSILEGWHELTPEARTLWLHFWPGIAVYDLHVDGCKPIFRHCGQPMEIFGCHSLGNSPT